MPPQGAVLFFTTSAALRAEKVLLAAGVPVKLIPTPRELTSDCGIACRFDWERREAVEATLRAEKVEHAGVRQLT